jgi:phosphoglycerate dehydrogenase-like enzyme
MTEWTRLLPERVRGKTVGIVGAGGIGIETIARLQPFGVTTLAVTRTGGEVPGATRSLGPEAVDEVLAASDFVVLAMPLTPETRGMIGARELELIGPAGWLINVARGAVVQTDALVDALRAGTIGGACLDVTDPEPLPSEHPLWQFPNVLITPHNANAWGVHADLFAVRVEENVARFRAGRELLGLVDPARSY